jgi:hypothetical protein
VLAGVKALRFASTRPAAGFGLDTGSAQATLWQLPPALGVVVSVHLADHRDYSELITRDARK